MAWKAWPTIPLSGAAAQIAVVLAGCHGRVVEAVECTANADCNSDSRCDRTLFRCVTLSGQTDGGPIAVRLLPGDHPLVDAEMPANPDVLVIRASIPILPDEMGWIDGASNSLGVQGPWYVYSDGQDGGGQRAGPCQAAGHADSECSRIQSPDPGRRIFPNIGGRMCMEGVAAQTLPLNGQSDYASMWGAGMGFELNHAAGDAETNRPFDAEAHQVVGVSFDLAAGNFNGGLRVEFRSVSTDDNFAVQAYWGADQNYPNSPYAAGTNIIALRDVRTPEPVPRPLDRNTLEGIQFLVPSSAEVTHPFDFCISNVFFLLGP